MPLHFPSLLSFRLFWVHIGWVLVGFDPASVQKLLQFGDAHCGDLRLSLVQCFQGGQLRLELQADVGRRAAVQAELP